MNNNINNVQIPSQSIAANRLRRTGVVLASILLLLLAAPALIAQALGVPSFLPSPIQIVSTVPANGDVNPYGVAFVPLTFSSGVLDPGDILVSNFNNSQNLQGTGTTIVRVRPNGQVSLFFTAQASQQGLSTALGIVKEGFVIVGNFPSPDGTCQSAGNGNLLVINNVGQQIQTITDETYINGPWDMAVFDFGGGRIDAFVTNGLSGNVTRFNLMVSGGNLIVQSKTTIASGYLHQCDPVTFVDAPTGLVYNPTTDILYVASSVDNAVSPSPTPRQEPPMLEPARLSTRTRPICTALLPWLPRPMATCWSATTTRSIPTPTSPARLWNLPSQANS